MTGSVLSNSLATASSHKQYIVLHVDLVFPRFFSSGSTTAQEAGTVAMHGRICLEQLASYGEGNFMFLF
jgi:hypothetical protein